MKKSEKNLKIPAQKKGTASRAVAQRKLRTENEAKHFFAKARSRLLNINQWMHYSGKGSGKFTLTDDQGRPIDSDPEKGNFIKIELPAPENKTGDGYEWVRIESIDDESDHETDRCILKVRPSANPMKTDNYTAHFYTDDATSTFVVERKGNRLKAAEYGRNEQANTHVSSITDKIRNIIVAIGARLGLAHIQWLRLMKGILNEK